MTGVVVLAGEPEYESYVTMRPIAALIAQELNADLHYRIPDVIADEPDFPVSTFGDLAALDQADLLVVYTRFRRLKDSDMRSISSYLGRGGGVIGLRTANHAFRFGPDSPWRDWNEGFGRGVLGSPWVRHHGHSSTTVVRPTAAAETVLTDFPDELPVRSWLYTTDLAPDCRVLLTGEPVNPEGPAEAGPVAWTRTAGGRRVFYTSLGHPDDLVLPPVRRLLLDAAGWAAGRESRSG